MLVSDLEVKLVQAQSEGRQPFLVVATAGTTILGAFDDISDIADLCDRHSVWLHVDVRPLAIRPATISRAVLVHGQVTIIFIVYVCLFVCAEFFSAVFDPISIKLGHVLYVRV